MEQTAIILIIITLFLLVIIVGLLTILIYRMIKQSSGFNPLTAPKAGDGTSHPDIAKSELHPAILERMKEAQKLKPKRHDLFCPVHSEEPGETMCSICDKLYCKACVRPYKSLYFCKEHLALVMRHEWEEVITMKTSTQDPEKGVRLYDVKKDLFEKEDIPTFIETHYKINVDQDYIETYLVMFAVRENLEKIKEKVTTHPSL